MPGLTLTHFSKKFGGLGDADLLLRQHRSVDQDHGLESEFVPFFEKRSKDTSVIPAKFSWRHSILSARRRFRKVKTRRPMAASVYHDFWGLKFLADLDQAERRIGIMHHSIPDMESAYANLRGLLDGVLCVTHEMEDAAARIWPDLDESRIEFLPYPVDQPHGFQPPARDPDRPFTVGYCGRIQLEQKRVDRIPEILERTAAHGHSFRMEFIGEGYDAPELERQLMLKHEAQFHGNKTGAEYWQILSNLDAILYTSEFEGLPGTLLDAMSVGVIPVYPSIGGGGEEYVRRIDEQLVYPDGDTAAAADQLMRLRSLVGPGRLKLRNAATEAAAPHLGGNYFSIFSEFVKKIHGMERVSRDSFGKKPRALADWCPFAVMNRLNPMAVWNSPLG